MGKYRGSPISSEWGSLLCISEAALFCDPFRMGGKAVRLCNRTDNAAWELAGISFVTTEPAPIMKPAPMVTPPTNQQLSPITIGAVYSRLVTTPVLGWTKES